MNKKLNSFFLVILTTIIFTSLSFADTKKELGIANFSEVEPGLYRGAQPDPEGFKTLKKMGIKTVMDFRKDSSIAKEEGWAEKEGIRFVSIPWRSSSSPSDSMIYSFLQIAENSKNRPLFVHCKRGKDRTGFMIAAYRISHNKWTEAQALTEMRRFGYHELWYPHLASALHRWALGKGMGTQKTSWEYLLAPAVFLRNITYKIVNEIFEISPIA